MSGATPQTATQRLARQRWLVLGLAATVVAAYFAPPAEDGGVVLSERAQRSPATGPSVAAPGATATAPASVPMGTVSGWQPQATGAAVGAAIGRTAGGFAPGAGAVLAIQPREAFSGDDSLFRGLAPALAAPQARPQPAAVVASAPTEEPVPRLNLKLIGRYVDNGATAAFVQLQDQNLVVRVGEVLSTHYRVEQIDEVSLTLRHLPSEQLQTFRLDAAP